MVNILQVSYQYIQKLDIQYRLVDIGTRTEVPLRFVTYLSKVMKINDKNNWVKTFWVTHYVEVQNFFSHNMDFMVIRRRRILHRFQKYKLNLVTKCTLCS
jgi:hypothetical protein